MRTLARPSYMPKLWPVPSSYRLYLEGQQDAYSTTIRDLSGYANHGTIVGATWARTGRGLWYLNFDGDDYVTLSKVISTPPLSVGVWIYPTVSAENKAIIGNNKAGGSGLDQGWELFYWSSSRLNIHLGTATGYGTGYKITGVNVNNWYCVVFSFDGSTLNAWVNGAQKITNQSHANYSDWNQAPVMGSFYNGSLWFYNGQIGLIAIDNGSAWGQTQATALYEGNRHLFGV